jgi:hypothetical protein
VVADESVRYVHAFDHGARHSSPTSGRAKNATPMQARSSTGMGMPAEPLR